MKKARDFLNNNNAGPEENNKRSIIMVSKTKYKIKTNTAGKLPEIACAAKKNAYRNHCYKKCKYHRNQNWKTFG